MEASTRARRLRELQAGRSFLWRSQRGWLAVGPTAVLTRAAAARPRGNIQVSTDAGQTTVRVMRVVGSWSRDGVDYSTAVFTPLPT